MKAVIITDAHANLPALQAIQRAIEPDGYDALFHLGDVVGIGPLPAETLDCLLNIPRAYFIMGNHEIWLVHGLPHPNPPWLDGPQKDHLQWTHEQISSSLKKVVAQWPFMIQYDFGGVQARFLHYALDESGRNFAPTIATPSGPDLDQLFGQGPAGTAVSPAAEGPEGEINPLFHRQPEQVIFYGHLHIFSDVLSRAHYINPGSLGCHRLPVARYTVAEFTRGSAFIEHREVPYDDTSLAQAFQANQGPASEFLNHTFFGGRF